LILFAVYAVVVWAFAFRWRRELRGFAAVIVGSLAAAGMGMLIPSIQRWLFQVDPNLIGAADPLKILLLAESALVLAGGLLIVVLPKPPAFPHCAYCHYDLRGHEPGQNVCPECGNSRLGFPPPRRYRRAASMLARGAAVEQPGVINPATSVPAPRPEGPPSAEPQ